LDKLNFTLFSNYYGRLLLVRLVTLTKYCINTLNKIYFNYQVFFFSVVESKILESKISSPCRMPHRHLSLSRVDRVRHFNAIKSGKIFPTEKYTAIKNIMRFAWNVYRQERFVTRRFTSFKNMLKASVNYPKGYPVPLCDVMMIVLLVLDDLVTLPGLPPLEKERDEGKRSVYTWSETSGFGFSTKRENYSRLSSSIRTERASHFSLENRKDGEDRPTFRVAFWHESSNNYQSW